MHEVEAFGLHVVDEDVVPQHRHVVRQIGEETGVDVCGDDLATRSDRRGQHPGHRPGTRPTSRHRAPVSSPATRSRRAVRSS